MMSSCRAAVAALVLGLCAAGLPAFAAEPPVTVADAARLTSAQQQDILSSYAQLLEARYLDVETGRRYAARLRTQLAAGAYADLTDPAAFGARVTADLQAVAPDRHLRLAPSEAFGRPRPAVPGGAGPKTPEGLEEARMIGDVAYMRFSLLPPAIDSGAAAKAFLLAHADARAVIIDARGLRGGSVPVMDAILPLFYERPTTLLRLEMRASGSDAGGGIAPSMARLPAPDGSIRLDHQVTPDATETRLRSTPVYYLTSRRTASAGEHLALALKRTGRGVLVGETTAGAGHFGSLERLPHGFAGVVPYGRTYDPDTGQGWEGRGVAPDVPTSADAALDEALARIAAEHGGRGPAHGASDPDGPPKSSAR